MHLWHNEGKLVMKVPLYLPLYTYTHTHPRIVLCPNPSSSCSHLKQLFCHCGSSKASFCLSSFRPYAITGSLRSLRVARARTGAMSVLFQSLGLTQQPALSQTSPHEYTTPSEHSPRRQPRPRSHTTTYKQSHTNTTPTQPLHHSVPLRPTGMFKGWFLVNPTRPPSPARDIHT